MGLFEQSQVDMQQITENLNDFGQNATITTPDGLTTVNIIGWHTKHHTKYDIDGVKVSSKNASLAFAEKQLIDVAYPVRNSQQDVSLLGHIITSKDSTGVEKTYIVNENFPDEYLGLIVLILGDYEPA